MNINTVLSNIWIWIATFMEQFIPKYIIPNIQLIIQIIILIIVALIVGKIGKTITIKLLNIIGLKRITGRTWAESMLRITGYRGTVLELIGDLIKWLIYILFLALMIQTIGFPGVAEIFTQVASVMPRIVGAIFIVVIGFIIADFFGKVFEEAARKIFKEDLAGIFSGALAKYTIGIISIIIALSLLGLDTVSLNIMFAIIMAVVVGILILGLKDTIPNYSSGMQVRSLVKVGDHVKIGEYSGIVEKINPTATILRSNKRSVLIPNSYFTKLPVEKIK
ncbi:MAG: mechanosensitive ion channel [Candidatus Aenigmarchaeota archaeon]|nr:mechanosensitive ion channel [Candidatus Aenigmarchaeota archaeon]